MSFRQKAWQQFRWRLVNTHGEVFIRDLDVAAMKQDMGRRAFCGRCLMHRLGCLPHALLKGAGGKTKVVSPSAFFLNYKASPLARELVARKALDGHLVSPGCAAMNPSDWPGCPNPRLVEASVPHDLDHRSVAATAGRMFD